MQHFILTRFNLRLWPHNKRGESTQTEAWLRQRCELFEHYCLPSVMGQTCQNFVWILLMDSESTVWLVERTKEWKTICPQIKCIGVAPQDSRNFVGVFQSVVNRLRQDSSEPCITTYLDNDDAIAVDFVEDVQKRLLGTKSGTVLTYIHGLQYFTELRFATKILFRHNHFLSLVEEGEQVRTIFGYGSHYYIHKNNGMPIIYIDPERPMWLEVVHRGNVDNDVWMTFDTRPVLLNPMPRFSISSEYTMYPRLVFLLRFLPRAIRVFFVHVRHKIFGHDWWR